MVIGFKNTKRFKDVFVKHVFEQEGVVVKHAFNESPNFFDKVKNYTIFKIKFEKYDRLKKKPHYLGNRFQINPIQPVAKNIFISATKLYNLFFFIFFKNKAIYSSLPDRVKVIRKHILRVRLATIYVGIFIRKYLIILLFGASSI